YLFNIFFFSSRRRHTRCLSDWSSDVCSSDLRAQLHQHLHRFVVGDKNVTCEKQDRNETKNQQDNEKARFEQLCESIFGEDKKPRPLRRQSSAVGIVPALIYGHQLLPFVPSR